MEAVRWKRVTEWNRIWSLAVVFGLAFIPWTYALVAGLRIPLWPSFVASATFYAAGDGLDGLARGYASNFAGIVYAAVTLALVNDYLGGSVLALSVVVGVFMFLASLHEFVPLLSFTPGAFFGYATMFSVHAADATAFGVGGTLWPDAGRRRVDVHRGWYRTGDRRNEFDSRLREKSRAGVGFTRHWSC